MASAKLFTNWTSKDFTWTWDKTEYTFKSGQSTYLQDYLANHFAKHLINRELNEQGLPTNHHTRDSLIAKCFGESFQAQSQTKLDSEVLNKESSSELNIEKKEEKRFCESCTSKGVKHKADCTRNEKKEEAFAGLTA